MKSADCLLSHLRVFRFLPFFISVHGLHGGTVTPCFRAHLINLSSSRHLLLGSSHSAPTQSLHTCAWQLRKNYIFYLVQVAICRVLLHVMTKISHWCGERAVLPCYANFLVSNIQGRPPKTILLKFIILAWGRRMNVFLVKQKPFSFTLNAFWYQTRLLELLQGGSQCSKNKLVQMGAKGKTASGDGLRLKQGTQPPDSRPLGLVRSHRARLDRCVLHRWPICVRWCCFCWFRPMNWNGFLSLEPDIGVSKQLAKSNVLPSGHASCVRICMRLK